VPNSKVVAARGAGGDEAYLSFLAHAAERLQAAGRPVSFLIHEGEGDAALARKANMRLQRPLDIVSPATAADAKLAIAGADAIISSRFHGLVSALAAGVPALACGWSHKYQALMQDYGLGDMLVNLDDRSSWSERIEQLIGIMASSDARSSIEAAAIDQKKKTQTMWKDVFKVIDEAQ
jgi:colanic acid/amylovoran biosynthesis protein